jgi:hypothetical protein
MEFNFNIRIVLTGDDSDSATEKELIEFITSKIDGGYCEFENKFIRHKHSCKIKSIEID